MANLKELKLEYPLVNGCGIISYLDGFDRLEKEGAQFGAWIIKSIGPFSEDPSLRKKYGWEKEKFGNPNPTVVYNGDVLLNSMALPSHAVESWIREFRNTSLSKPIIGSAWGKCPDDYKRIIEIIDKYVQAWELNVSCPNFQVGECSVMDSMSEHVYQIVSPIKDVTDKPVIAKLSPNEAYVSMAQALIGHVDYISCGNTLGPGLVVDIYSRRPVLAGKYGGMSGHAIMPKTAKMVEEVYNVVKDSGIKIIANGGIERWQDAIEYAICGASLFGLGTSMIKELPDGRVVGKTTKEIVQMTRDINQGIAQFLEDENTTLDGLVGTLRY